MDPVEDWRTRSQDWQHHGFYCPSRAEENNNMRHRQEHYELLYAFRIVSDNHSYIDPTSVDAWRWMNPFPSRVLSDVQCDTAEQLADKESMRIEDLRLYNWYFHTCRVEVRAKGGIIDGRPELHRQDYTAHPK